METSRLSSPVSLVLFKAVYTWSKWRDLTHGQTSRLSRPEILLCVMGDNRSLVGRGGGRWHYPVLASSEAREDWVRVRLRGERLGRGWLRLSVRVRTRRGCSTAGAGATTGLTSQSRSQRPGTAGPRLVSLVWVRSCLAQCAIAPGRCPIWAGHCQIVERRYLKQWRNFLMKYLIQCKSADLYVRRSVQPVAVCYFHSHLFKNKVFKF